MRWFGIAMAFGLAFVVVTDTASAGQNKHRTKKPAHKAARKVVASRWTGAENGLIGIKLYDSAEHVIRVYGSPDQVEAIGSGGSTMMGGGQGGPGAGMGPGGPGGPNGGMMPGRMSGGGSGAPRGPMGRPAGGADVEVDPFAWANDIADNQAGAGGLGPPAMPGGAAGPGGGGGRPGGMGPTGPGGPGQGFGGGKNGGGGIPGSNGGAADRVTLTRWVYNRGGSKYGFIIDKSGRVVQIEAIGLDNSQVKTKRGVGFGSTFSSIFTDYQQPDGYEISGDNLMMKYLVHDNVAFRLSRLGPKKPQVVTGIVVAAGKS